MHNVKSKLRHKSISAIQGHGTFIQRQLSLIIPLTRKVLGSEGNQKTERKPMQAQGRM